MTDVLAVAEHRRGEVRDVSFELVTAGRELADATGGNLHLAIINGPVETFAAELDREGVDGIHTVDAGDEFNHDIYVQVIEQLFEAVSPQFVLAPNSVNGLDYAPAVAATLELPIVTDVVDLSLEDETLLATREMYGGKVETTIEVATDSNAPVVVTVRGGEWAASTGAGNATIEAFTPEIEEAAIGSKVIDFEDVAGGDVDISEAEVLVSVGRGIDEEENLELIHDLADALGATVSSSRPIVDAGWLEKSRQVGQSGKVVTPEVYLAIGISGAVQHVAGMKGSETIVAINTDSNAPIMDIADYAIHGDLFEVVPALVEEFGA